MKVTLSVIKADIGGYVGHSDSHPECLAIAEKMLAQAKKDNKVADYHVTKCGDDLELIITHKKGGSSQEIHGLAWDVFVAATDVAKRLKLYGAGQDLLSDAFSGNVKGLGPGVAEMEIDERISEPVIILMADKTSSGAWNLPLYKMFADPFNTAGLVISETMHNGFIFEVLDVKENKRIFFKTPEEIYDLLLFIGSPSRYMIKNIYHKDTKQIGATSSTQKLSYIAGKYVGKDDPVCIIRAQGNFPAVGEIVEPFAEPTIVEGWMRGSHYGPLMPVSMEDGVPTRFDGPPRVVAYGFQLADGHLVGPRDMFKDKSFDDARQKASDLAYALRKHGPFEPHRLPLEELEYTTMPQVMAKLASRWEEIKD